MKALLIGPENPHFLGHLRTLQALPEVTAITLVASDPNDAELQVVQLPGENPRYERAGRHHHHHFQCRSCQRVFDVHACPGNLARMAPEGFSVEDHELTLYGRCADCRPAAA